MNYAQKKDTAINKSFEKGLRIIEVLAENDNSLKLKELAKLLGYDVSTVFRFLNTLVKCDYATQDPNTLKYSLTYRVCHIADEVKKSVSIRKIAHPYLKELVSIFKESVTLSCEHEMSVVYLDVIEGNDHILSTTNYIGRIAPIHCTGAGKLFLLNYSDEDLDLLIQKKGLKKYTENTITSKEKLKEELKKVNELGYAFDNEECEYGVKCIAFPIKNSKNKVVAAFSVTGPMTRLTDKLINSRIDHLYKTSKLLSEKYGDSKL